MKKTFKNIELLVLACAEGKINTSDEQRVQFARAAAAVCFHCIQAKGFRDSSEGKFKVKQAVKRVVESTDTRFPVAVVGTQATHTLFQYTGKHLGRYFTDNEKTTATELGISAKYTENGVVKLRQLKAYRANTPITWFKSVAKSCVDTWSEPGKVVTTTGGGVQLLMAHVSGTRPADLMVEELRRRMSM